MYFIWDLISFSAQLPLMSLKRENFIIFLGAVFFFIIIKKQLRKLKILYSGYKGEKTVANTLRKIANKKGFTVMNDVLLPLYDNMTQIDHIVIGPFGVVCVETKNHSGKITGKVEDIYWKQRLGFRTYTLYNPLIQNNTHVRAINHFLHKEKILNVPVYNLVVFASDNVSIELDRENWPVIPVRCLKKYFKNEAFNEAKINTEQIIAAIKKYLITDKSAKKQHIKQLKRTYG